MESWPNRGPSEVAPGRPWTARAEAGSDRQGCHHQLVAERWSVAVANLFYGNCSF